MSLLGKLKTAIKGNPVLKEYELGRHVASAGPGLLWKVYDGVKRSTKQDVSVFIFYKQTPEVEKLSKKEREMLFEMLKRGPTHLARLRHPRILTIDHPVEESSDCIAFTTEPVFASLANVLGYYDNLPSPLPVNIKEHQLHTLEVHYGLLQVAEGINFLHDHVKMMHGDINLNSVVIGRHGNWKLAGFNFGGCVNEDSLEQQKTPFDLTERKWPSHPSMNYLAPEAVLSNTWNEKCDLYSFGMLIFSIYNAGKPLFDCRNNSRTYKQNIEQISRISESALGDTPLPLRPLVRSLLVIEPSVRPDALQITKHQFFEDVLVCGLQYIDALVEKTDIEKSQWFKGTLARLINKYPKRILHQRLLPALGGEFRNHKMIPFVLPLVLLIAEDCSIEEYSTQVLPILIPAFRIHNPIQVPLILLQKMDLLLKLTSPDERKLYILPMILGAMESNSSQLQELCMTIIPTFADMIDYSSMKHSIIPRITDLSLNTNSTSLRIKCLVAIGQMMDTLDKGIVTENILPAVYRIKSREPGVLMGILGIVHKTFISSNLGFDKVQLANKILPFLVPLSIDNNLNVTQFNQFIMVIKEMLKRIEVDQRAHLEQLAKMEEQTKSTVAFAKEVSEAKAIEDTAKGIETFGGKEESFIAKLGSVPSKQQPVMTKNDDIFAGLGLDTMQPLSSATPPLVNKTTPTPVTRKIDFSEAKATPPQLNTWEVPQLTGGLAPPTKSSVGSNSQAQSSSSMGMGLMQPTQTHSGSSMGMGLMQPTQTHSGSSTGMGLMQPTQTHSSSSMGIGLMQPTQTHSGSSTGMGLMQSTQTHSGSSTGMGLMQPTQTHSSSSTRMGWSSTIDPHPQTSVLQPTHSSGMGLMQPTQTHSNSSMGMGWSSTIDPHPQTSVLQPSQTQSNSSMGMGLMQPTQTHSSSSMGMGWSSTIDPHSQTSVLQPSQTQSNSSMGMSWSSAIKPHPQASVLQSHTSSSMGMGLMQPTQTQSNSSMGMGLMQPTQTHSSSGMGMGLMQSTQAHFSSGMGMRPATTQSNWTPAAGANPFADFNSLL